MVFQTQLVLAALVFCSVAAAQSPSTQERNLGLRPPSKVTSKDVLEMHAAGLSDDIVAEKIKASTCEFDTSPSILTQLKAAGVSELLILAMIRCSSNSSTPPSYSASEGSPLEPRVVSGHTESFATPSGYVVTYVKSDRQWKYSIQHEPYNQVSEDFEEQLGRALDGKGLHQMPVLDPAGCCRITLELLEVTTHPAVMKKIGIDVSANVTVTDASGRFIYNRGYRGELRTLGGISHWHRWISEAVGDMVKNIVADENVTRVLATGQL
jgi:hypothetical protein